MLITWLKEEENKPLVTSGGLSEFQRYLNQPLLEIDEEGSFDLLGWWKTNQSIPHFPLWLMKYYQFLFT